MNDAYLLTILINNFENMPTKLYGWSNFFERILDVVALEEDAFSIVTSEMSISVEQRFKEKMYRNL